MAESARLRTRANPQANLNPAAVALGLAHAIAHVQIHVITHTKKGQALSLHVYYMLMCCLGDPSGSD